MKKQQVLPTLILIALLAGLGAMMIWRFNQSVESNKWLELVVSAPKQLTESAEQVEKTQAVLDEAESADFQGKRFAKAAMLREETVTAMDEYSEVLQYVEEVPEVDEGPLAAAADPLSLGDAMEAREITARVPKGMRVQLTHFSTLRERLIFSTQSLRDATADLQDGLGNLVEIKGLQSKWAEARKQLQKQVKDSKTLLEQLDLRIGRWEGNPVDVFALEIEKAEHLLADKTEVPDDIDELKEQTSAFKKSRKELQAAGEKAEQEVLAVEEEAHLQQVLAELEAQRLAEQQYEEETFNYEPPAPAPAPQPAPAPEPVPPPAPDPGPAPEPSPEPNPEPDPGPDHGADAGD